MVEVASIVMFTARLKETTAFYEAIGVPLVTEDHGEGELHAAGEVGGIHLAVLASKIDVDPPQEQWRSSGSTFVGFYVSSLDKTIRALLDLGATTLEDHQVRPWGCRFVIADPDGRAVEINQQEHWPNLEDAPEALR